MVSWNYGSPEVPSPAVCKLENQESWWCKSQSESRRTRSTDVWGQGKKDVPAREGRAQTALPLPFCSVQALSGLDEACLQW